jgi:hypothetical protein
MRIEINTTIERIPLARSDFRYNGSERVLRKSLEFKLTVDSNIFEMATKTEQIVGLARFSSIPSD